MSVRKITLQVQSIIMLAVLLAACGAPPETPVAPAVIEVVNIINNDIETGQIIQKRSFNQCEADIPISATIQFSETSGQASQKALTLSGSGGVQVGLDKLAELKLEGSVQEYFSVTREESHGTQESITIQVPARTRLEYTIVWKEVRRTGTIEYLENKEPKFINFSYRTGVEIDSSSVKNLDCSLPTETPLPTFTPAPTVTSEPVKEATVTPMPEPKTLSDGCIFAKTWAPYSSSMETLGKVSQKQDGCYSTEALGVFADRNGILHIKLAEQKTSSNFGIYTSINNNSVVQFNIHVNYMHIAYEDNPLTVNFVIAPDGDLAAVKNSTRFNLTVINKGKSEPVIHYFLADAGENTGTRLGSQHYEYGHNYTIRFELSGNTMRIFINGYKLQEELFIPAGQKVFYIGYNLPIISSADVEISGITIDGVAK
jgi:hypothetical protein